jgi:hypothetical protein
LVLCRYCSDLLTQSTRQLSPTEFIVALSLDASEELIEVFFVAELEVTADDILGRLSAWVTQDSTKRRPRPAGHGASDGARVATSL